jgi:4-hydroxybenzoate polyprenyltransferase
MHASAVGGLVRACHPEPTLAVTVVAAGLAVSVGLPALGVLLVAAAVVTGQLSVGWLNDYLDADRDRTVLRADKPVVTGAVSRTTVGTAALCAGLACVPLSLASGLLAGTVHLVAVVSAWAYDLGLKSTGASVVPYALSFGLLPVFVVLAAGGSPPWWLVTTGALLGAGAHFANAMPDLADDTATGVRSLPQRLGHRVSGIAAAVLLLSALVVLVFGPGGAPHVAGPPMLAAAAAALSFGAVASRRAGSRALFRAVLFTALLAVLLLMISFP